MGERDLAGEGVALRVAGRVVVVVVEPALADRDRADGPVEQVADGGDAEAGLVRVQPDRGVDVVEAGGDGERLLRGRRGRTRP